MSKRPYVVRKWTDGLRVVAEAEQVAARGGAAKTFDNKLILPKLLDAVDPGAGARYRSQMRNSTLTAFRILTREETDAKYGVFHVSFTEGSDFPNHYHKHSQATIMIVEGSGWVILDGQRHEIATGDVVHIPPGTAHEFFVGRGVPRFTYVSITEPDIVMDEEVGQIDWYTLPSGRYSEDGTIRNE
jgi:quercetin dioxygenase-like cupin family protein